MKYILEMLTYQYRPHYLKIEENQTPSFPAEVEVRICFQPLQPFGKSATGGLTTVKSKKVVIYFNLVTGQHFVECTAPLSPLDITIENPHQLVIVKGNCIKVKLQCEKIEDLKNTLESLYFILPVLLAVEFADPPYIELVEGSIGSVPFRWELSRRNFHIDITTQELQKSRFIKSWERFGIISASHRRRLVAALHYFHVACRLKREEKSPGEFLAESLLNFNKILEVLFSPQRDQVRASLSQLGYSNNEIEKDFIPVMLLRNSIDIGHPLLALFTPTELETIHEYTDRVEATFRNFLQKL